MSDQPTLGGGPNSRPFEDTLAETGPGLPDEAVRREQRPAPEQIELAQAGDAEAIAAKLEREARSWASRRSDP